MDYPEIYAVDFDKTLNLAENYPDLGEPNRPLFDLLIRQRAAGDKVVLWTCREGDLLRQAVEYCRNYGLEFDAVNENTKENRERRGNDCRKVFADYYIDDRNLLIADGILYIGSDHPNYHKRSTGSVNAKDSGINIKGQVKNMERLTRMINVPGGSIVVYTKGRYGDTTSGEMRTEDIRTVMKRLAEYEKTDLTPEQILELKERDTEKNVQTEHF